jgi:hypothetical protein
MKAENKIIHFSFRNFLLSFINSTLVIGAFWIVSALLQAIGCPLPVTDKDKFLNLALFIFSNFSFITFLAMIPFQQAEGKLSPGFYAHIFNQSGSHFGLSILMNCFVLCMLIVGVYETTISEKVLNQLFIAMIGSMVFAVIFERNRALRYLYRPLMVYENIASLAQEENIEDLWLDLYECNLKAIKENRVNDAISFFKIMALINNKTNKTEIKNNMQRDLLSLYRSCKDQHPLAREMRRYWPALDSDERDSIIHSPYEYTRST